jgi:trimethylamine---corrinoid protein Co-methyltransferase
MRFTKWGRVVIFWANYTTAFFDSKIADNDPFETWSESGGHDSALRANKRWKAALAEYQAPKLDDGIKAALQDFVARKKASMPDQWY